MTNVREPGPERKRIRPIAAVDVARECDRRSTMNIREREGLPVVEKKTAAVFGQEVLR
jgi:hypothetical protein